MIFRTIAMVASAFAILVCTTAAVHAAPKVVASILPVHSLIAGVMAGVGEPDLLLRGGSSPHVYALKGSQARAIENADVIFWIGESMESFLVKSLVALPRKATVVKLSAIPGIRLHAAREGGTWAAHAHEEGHHEQEGHGHAAHDDHDEHRRRDEETGATHLSKDDGEAHGHQSNDLHLWLNPHNAEVIVRHAADVLSEVDGGNTKTYRANAARILDRLERLEAEVRRRLSGVKNRPFIVLHDAYQYFEKHFDMNGVGSITVSPERAPGAKRVAELRKKLAKLHAACVFSDAQFRPAFVQTITRGTGARTGTLDPLGAGLTPGPGAYFELMDNLARSFQGCLFDSS